MLKTKSLVVITFMQNQNDYIVRVEQNNELKPLHTTIFVNPNILIRLKLIIYSLIFHIGVNKKFTVTFFVHIGTLTT